MFMIVFISLHILCLLMLFAIGKIPGRQSLSVSQYIIAALVPLFGPLCLLSILLNTNRKPDLDKIEDINQMKIEDEIYRSIIVKPVYAAEGIVPVEESLLFNPAQKRRQLLLNVLSMDAARYVPSLRLAGINDDTEVVHYAVTALVELRNDFNDRLNEMEQKMDSSPDDPETLREYIDLEEEYLRSMLPEKGELRETINHYDKLLEKTADDSLTADEKSLLIQKRAENAMALRDYKRALPFIDQLITMEPEKEKGYLLKIHCLSALKNRSGIDAVIRRIDDQQVFLSEKGRKALAFWQPGGVNS